MILSKMENNKRVWTQDVEEIKDRTLIGKELVRVGFKKRKNSFLIEGSPSKDKPKKKQGIFILEYTDPFTLKGEWGVFFIRWSSPKELDNIYFTLSGLKPPTVSTMELWNVVHELWVESVNKVGDFSFLYDGRVRLKEKDIEQDHGRINFIVE